MRLPLMRTAAAVALAALAFGRPAFAADRPASAELLPPSVYAYVSVPDVGVLKDRVGKSAFGEMLRDPKLADARAQVLDAINTFGDQVQSTLGVTLEEIAKVPSGAVTFAVVQTEKGGPVGVVMLLDHRPDDATVTALIKKAEAGLKEKGGRRTTESFEGTEIAVYTIDKPKDGDSNGLDEPAGAKPAANTTAFFDKDARLVIGNGVPALESVLARWAGGKANSFAANETFEFIRDKTKSDDRPPVLVFYVDPIGSLQAGIRDADNAPPALQFVPMYLPALGLTKLKAIGGSVDVATEEFDSVAKVYFYVEQPTTGVLGLFRFPAAELAPPAWVDEAANTYFSANWDVAGAYLAVQNVFNQLQGPGGFERVVEQYANNPSGPKVHPKKDIVDQLTGRIHVASFPAPKASGDDEAGQQPSIFAAGVKDEQKMKALFARLAKTEGFPGKVRDFQGTQVYDLPVKNPTPGGPDSVSLAVAKGNLFFSNVPARLEEVLRSKAGKPLADSKQYQRVAGHFPPQASLVLYQDQRDQLRASYEAVRSGESDSGVPGIDGTKLPPFEDVERYLLNSGTYAVPDENGALIVSFSLKLEK